MKMMTCQAMGGPCATEIHGAAEKEMMDKGTAHVKEMTSRGDLAHQKVLDEMNKMTPEDSKAWQDKFSADFVAAPDVA